MLVVVSDTHGTGGHRLTGRTLAAVEAADLVVHAGDFTTAAVLDAFEAAADRLAAVRGNNDDPAVADRLPEVRTETYAGARLAVVHTRPSTTDLTMLGREREADLVVFGHSHRPGFDGQGPVALLNPGSHAQPRRHRAAHAELRPDGDGLDGRLRTPEGETLERFRVPAGSDGASSGAESG